MGTKTSHFEPALHDRQGTENQYENSTTLRAGVNYRKDNP